MKLLQTSFSGMRPARSRFAGFSRQHPTISMDRLTRPKYQSGPSEASLSSVDEEQFGGEACFAPQIDVNNEADPQHTVITLESVDFPGLLRVITWVLNGHDVVVENADLSVGTDKIVTDRFWVTDNKGRKLSKDQTMFLEIALREHVATCTPKSTATEGSDGMVLMEGNILVDNNSDPNSTMVVIFGDRKKQGLFMELCAAIAGVGLNVLSAQVHSCDSEDALCYRQTLPGDVDLGPLMQRDANKMFRFRLQDVRGKKLDYGRAASLLFTLNVLLNRSWATGPLTPPTPAVFKGKHAAKKA